MKKATLITIAVIAIFVILSANVSSTIAWITATTSTLDNTFTVGNVDITLTEPQWDAETEHFLVPGKPLVKDPIVTVLAYSEKCYVFVKIETTAFLDNCIEYDIDSAWTSLGVTYPGIYYTVAEKSAADTVIPVLADNKVTVSGTITAADLAAIGIGDTMKITAYSIQFDYLTSSGTAVNTAESAWVILNTAAPTP